MTAQEEGVGETAKVEGVHFFECVYGVVCGDVMQTISRFGLVRVCVTFLPLLTVKWLERS